MVAVAEAEVVGVVAGERNGQACCRRRIRATMDPARLKGPHRAREGPPPPLPPRRKGEMGRKGRCRVRWWWRQRRRLLQGRKLERLDAVREDGLPDNQSKEKRW